MEAEVIWLSHLLNTKSLPMPFNYPERHRLFILWDFAPVFLTVSDFFLNVYLLYSDFLINKHMYILYNKTFWFPVGKLEQWLSVLLEGHVRIKVLKRIFPR